MQTTVRRFSESWLGGFFITFLFFLFAMSFAGCSDSDGGGGALDGGDTSRTPVSSLQGRYFMGLFADSGGSFWNQVDAVDYDGQGGLTSNIVYDSDGDTGTFNATYSLATDGVMSITGTDIVGIASNDTTLLSQIDTVPTDADTEIVFGMSVQTSSGMSTASVNGTYTFCQIRHDAERVKTARLQFVFDGAGTVSGSVEADSDGGLASLSGTYAISDTGSLDLTITGLAKDFIGQVSPDGNVILILDEDNDGEVLFMVGLKTTTGADKSLLSGDYRLNQFGGNNSSSWTTMIDMTADGNGGITADILADSGGDLDAPPDLSYGIDPHGTIVITGTDEVGIVSPDGEIFAIVNAVEDSDGDVSLTIGVKKS